MMQTTQAWAGVAGYFQFVSGEVRIATADGKSHKAVKGGAVNEGDTIISTNLGTAQIKMQDGGFIAVRPDTQLKIDNFKYSGKAGEPEKSAVSLLKGGFRAVTGMVGRVNKQDYSITTPVATIGIRGTDHESYHLPVAKPGALAGTYDKVNVGETSITTDSGTLNVLPNQMGFAGGLDQPPQLRPINLHLFGFSPAPLQGGDGGGGGNDGVRDNAVVDGQDSNPGPNPNGNDNNAGGIQGALLPTAVIVATDPCVGTQPLPASCTLISGGAAPLTAPVTPTTAAYVQTDKAVAIATSGIAPAASTLPIPEVGTFIAAPADVNNALPNPFAVDRYAGHSAGNSVTYTLNGTTTIVGAATTIAATGIQYGSFTSTSSQKSVVGTVNCCAPGVYTSPGSVYSHWIVGPAVNPVYLPEVLTGTVNYTFAGGTVPTVSYNDVAALTGSSLLVNFAQQAVSFSLSGTLGAGTPIPWSAGASGVPLQTMYWNNAKAGFRATTAARTGWSPLTVGGAVTSGDVVGQLTGNALNGAIVSYVLSNGNGQIAGVAAYTGTAQNTATPYRIVGMSTIDTVPAGLTGAGTVVPVTMGGYNNSANVLTDVNGNVTKFHSGYPFSNGTSAAIGIGTATAAGLGTDPVSGISWGRWVGGSLDVSNLVTNAVTNLPNNPNSAHWIAGPVMTGPVDLPISGTFNYVLAGGTTPTDSLGGVGTLNSASLTANFTAQTVNVALNVTTPNAGNLVANGAAIPIEQKSFFNASTANSAQGSNLGLLTVNGTGTTSGNLGGVFVGTGGIGAVMLYGLQNNAVQVNGVVAFHR
ncbi:MAG: FecR domain-containing protein [Gallionella sp.]|nr:FecR domain-containing protein [Gallionella sp.]MDD4945994.1 FecR domain-containing protein [Gallionella sp.]